MSEPAGHSSMEPPFSAYPASFVICWVSLIVYAIPFLVCIGIGGWGLIVGSGVWRVCLYYLVPYLWTCPAGVLCAIGCRDRISASLRNLVICLLFRLPTLLLLIYCVAKTHESEQFHRRGPVQHDLTFLFVEFGMIAIWVLLAIEMFIAVLGFFAKFVDELWRLRDDVNGERKADRVAQPKPATDSGTKDGSFSEKPLPKTPRRKVVREQPKTVDIKRNTKLNGLILAAVLLWISLGVCGVLCAFGGDIQHTLGIGAEERARKKMDADARKAFEDAIKKK